MESGTRVARVSISKVPVITGMGGIERSKAMRITGYNSKPRIGQRQRLYVKHRRLGTAGAVLAQHIQRISCFQAGNADAVVETNSVLFVDVQNGDIEASRDLQV